MAKLELVPIQTELPVEFEDPVYTVFTFWKVVIGHERSQLGPKRRMAIKRALEMGYSVDDLRLAIVGCKYDAWSQGANNRQKAYQDIELICRDETKIDDYLVMGESYVKQRIAKEQKQTAEAAPENKAVPMPPEVRAQLEKIFGRALKRPTP